MDVLPLPTEMTYLHARLKDAFMDGRGKSTGVPGRGVKESPGV